MICALCRFNLSFLCKENENSLRKQLSHVYYLLEGKNPFWNVKCDRQAGTNFGTREEKLADLRPHYLELVAQLDYIPSARYRYRI